MNVIVRKLKEPSTIKGILALSSLIGLNMSDEVIQAASEIILALLALWEIIRKERAIPKAQVVEDEGGER
jgi:ABC-type nickel/cobalt efflux system permease component RcnA